MLKILLLAAAAVVYISQMKDFIDKYLLYAFLFLNIIVAGQSYFVLKLTKVRRVRFFVAGLIGISLAFIGLRFAYIATDNLFFYYAIPSLYVLIWLGIFYALADYESILKAERDRLKKDTSAEQKAKFYAVKIDELEKISERAAPFITEQPNQTTDKYLH